MLEIPTGLPVQGWQLWRSTGNLLLIFIQFYVYDWRFKLWGPTTFLTEIQTLLSTDTRLLHSLGLVDVGLSVGYETWLPVGWHHSLVIGWSKYNLGIPQLQFWAHVTGGNLHYFSKATDSHLAQPQRQASLPLGLCKETVKGFILILFRNQSCLGGWLSTQLIKQSLWASLCLILHPLLMDRHPRLLWLDLRRWPCNKTICSLSKEHPM